MAAPWVSGTVALMMQAAGRPLTIYEIRRALIGSVDPHPGPAGLSSSSLGYGYLNVAAAVDAARKLRHAAQATQMAAPPDAALEETGWAPISAEDAEHAIAAEAAPSPCGCGGGHTSVTAERDDSEAEIEMPFEWSDVRDALEALADEEEPA